MKLDNLQGLLYFLQVSDGFDKNIINNICTRRDYVDVFYQYSDSKTDHLHTAKLFYGDNILVDLNDEVGRNLFIYGVFEPETAFYIYNNLCENDYFIDIGAHTGFYAHLASRKIASGQIHVIEPSHRSFYLCERNLKHITNCHLHKFAISSQNGTAIFHDFGAHYSPYSGLSDKHRAIIDISKDEKCYEVKTVTLEKFLEENIVFQGNKLWIKLDIEGFEYSVIRNHLSLLRKLKPNLIVEFGGGDIELNEKLKALFIDEGVSVFEIDMYGLKMVSNLNELDLFNYRNLLLKF
ncbi:FkbM family methyltransferase [Vibrio cholerae]|uniref:FkbM family methyltransferase n=1 Tax=Vibrio cholerae TaxID=666 RepID=UPI0004E2D3FA|nr:FkbM family methyltransferase [Vibrio cholerae]EGR1088997.1 FkbM family methyltransferase [Vibrio cholerae]KFE23428.1 methyltransferase, FkbM family domain protein [Vibrio cholerae]TXZ28691.1 FkbM family methyltransferase [Vibrio cholerae]BCK27011.1 hypothetical protein VCSRO77_0341 [Vibrio cholerae]BCN21482.1 putative monosaccharide biosynthesis protein [Vibrio cholerae]